MSTTYLRLVRRIKRIDFSSCVFNIVNGITRLDIARNDPHSTTQAKFRRFHYRYTRFPLTSDLTLDLWRSAVPDSVGPTRSQPNLLWLQLLRNPEILVCLLLLTVVTSITNLSNTDQHTLTTRAFCDLALVT